LSLDIQFFGGFRVDLPEGRRSRFESQKVRALLAYLACQRDVDLTRDHLADLLWPDAEPDAARRNLRQAIYNLRQGLGEHGGEMVDGRGNHSVRFRLVDGVHLDVADFVTARRRGLPGGDEVVAGELVRAADLYRGDFLAGFVVRDSPAFEDWVITEQERLRDAAVQTLHTLVEHFSARGEYDAAVPYCRRLIDLDPLSEEAHRELMRLHVLSGRRRRALAHYRDLERLLRRELGVEPMPESRQLFTSIQAEEMPLTPASHAPPAVQRVPPGPFVPLQGRRRSLEALGTCWSRAARGQARFTLVEGEVGIGKTRLLKSFLSQLSERRQAAIVQGRCHFPAPWAAGEPLLGAVRGLEQLTAGDAETTARHEELPLADRLQVAIDAALPATSRSRRPTVFFLDDLHLASTSVLDLVAYLLDAFHDRPLWIVAACESSALPASHPLLDLATDHGADRLPLARLDDPEVEAICRALLGAGSHAATLARHLFQTSEGLPLAVVESINSLCDRSLLVSASRSLWTLEAHPAATDATPEELERLIVERADRLPTSIRRLATMAAAIGPVFDVDLLQRAAREHIGVVEIGIEVMLERWLIRQYARRWTDDPRERDLVLWAQGARRGSFEFAHPALHAALYGDLPTQRRRSLHLQVANALAERYEPGRRRAASRIARHYLLADDPAQALPYLHRAAASAADLGDHASAGTLYGLAADQFERVLGEADEDERSGWDELRREVEAGRAALG
jgi:DNA-binding SARP family transcriptional activator